MFAAGDWTCSGCGNTNWARRNTCNMCNTPKPGTVDVNREGTAGGFKVRYTSTAGLGKLEWARCHHLSQSPGLTSLSCQPAVPPWHAAGSLSCKMMGRSPGNMLICAFKELLCM